MAMKRFKEIKSSIALEIRCNSKFANTKEMFRLKHGWQIVFRGCFGWSLVVVGFVGCGQSLTVC